MKTKLHKELKAVLEFYQKQHATPPAEYACAPGLINSPSFFTIKDLQSHLNNPLLNPSWVHLISHGKSVPLQDSCFFKSVQSNQLPFMDKTVMNKELKNGAAVVLEGIDILDAGVNYFVSKLDNTLPCSLCNCVAMFSQQDNEAYTGHFDSEDVLVIQLSGKKLWNLYAPMQRKFVDSTHLTPEQLGPPIKQLTVNPGDVLYVRAGIPHMCQTTGDHSLHLAFDLVDSTPNVEQITGEANKFYDHACADAYVPASKVMEQYIELVNSPEFQGFLESATQNVKEDAKAFRECMGNSSTVHALSRFF